MALPYGGSTARHGRYLGPPLRRGGYGMRKVKARRIRRVLAVAGIALFACVAVVGAYMGYTIYKIDRAVHHVAISPALLAKTHSDLLAVVRGPHHSEEIYAFHTTSGHTNVLSIPSTLEVTGPAGTPVALSALNIHSPALIISGLRHASRHSSGPTTSASTSARRTRTRAWACWPRAGFR